MTEISVGANGCIFTTYPCKFTDNCKQTGHFNPVATLLVTIKSITKQPKTIVKLNPCMHGGGSGCHRWKHLTDKEIGWYRPLPNRSINQKAKQ